MSGRLKAVIGTFDDGHAGLGPPPPLVNSPFSVQVPIRFQLPVPDDFSDCISELHVIGRLQIELDKSIARVQQVIANGSYSPDPYPQSAAASSGASGISSAQELNLRGTGSMAPAASVAVHPTKDLDTDGFPPKLAGFATYPQPELMHSTLHMMAVASPAAAFIESPMPHELSAISHEPLTQAGKAADRADSVSTLRLQEASIENRRLFLTPAPASRESPPSQLRPLERANLSVPNAVDFGLQRDASRTQSLNSRNLGAISSAFESSSTGAVTLERVPADRPLASMELLGGSAKKLNLQLQAMDAKNREIDTLLAQFLQRQTASRNASFQSD